MERNEKQDAPRGNLILRIDQYDRILIGDAIVFLERGNKEKVRIVVNAPKHVKVERLAVDRE
jgi:sRNA-binding carbon storage regulator CsrA